MIHRLEVSYNVTRPGYVGATDRVAITEGYTTVQDIPKMIGIRRGVSADEIEITLIHELTGQ